MGEFEQLIGERIDRLRQALVDSWHDHSRCWLQGGEFKNAKFYSDARRAALAICDVTKCQSDY